MSIGRFERRQAWNQGKRDGSCGFPPPTGSDHPTYEYELKSKFEGLIHHSIYRSVHKFRKKWEKCFRDCRSLNVKLNWTQHKLNETLKDSPPNLNKLDVIEEQYSQLTPVPYQYWVLLILLMVFEFPLNAKIFEIFGSNVPETKLMAFGLCLSVPLTAHFLGIRTKIYAKERLGIGYIFLLLVVITLTLFSVAILRALFIDESIYTQRDKYVYLFISTFFGINLVIFMLAWTASRDLHPFKDWHEYNLFNKLKKSLKSGKIQKRRYEKKKQKLIAKVEKIQKKMSLIELQGHKRIEEIYCMAKEKESNYQELINIYRRANIKTRIKINNADVFEIEQFNNIKKLDFTINSNFDIEKCEEK